MLISLAEIFAWMALGGAALCLLRVKEGFSVLEACMGLLYLAALLFSFPILTKSIYLANETDGSMDRPDNDIIILYEKDNITLNEEQMKKRYEYFIENSSLTLDDLPYEVWKRKGTRVINWGFLTEEQKKKVCSRKVKDGEVIYDGDEEDFDVSSVVALGILIALAVIMQFLKFTWSVPYCVVTPIVWVVYFFA